MSEEIKNNGMELSDAELEGVSGGYYNYKAYYFCGECKRNSEQYGWKDSCMGGSRELLTPYTDGMHDYFECPFFNGPLG